MCIFRRFGAQAPWIPHSRVAEIVDSVEAVQGGRSATDVDFGAGALIRKVSLGVHKHEEWDDERYLCN